MRNLLDFFAAARTPDLHALGRAGTRLLLEALHPAPGERILELGFGTGHTLIELRAACSGLELYGWEQSARMLDAARRRHRFCGVGDIRLDAGTGPLPYPDHFFDAAYAESVLAILPDAELPGVFAELYRVLKPGGRLCCNETLWLPGTDPDTIRSINALCLVYFGIPQASEQYPCPADWEQLGQATGFRSGAWTSLEGHGAVGQGPGLRLTRRSDWYSRWSWVLSRLSPGFRAERRHWRAREREFLAYGHALEGGIFVFQK